MTVLSLSLETVIHPTAIVASDAILEPGVEVAAFCVIESGVRIGAGTQLGVGAQVLRYTTLGRHNKVGSYAILGGEPMDLKYKGEISYLEVGDHNTIREFTTIHRATGEGEVTKIGSNNFIMAYVHVTHNCILGDYNIIPNAAQIAGHVVIEDYVTFGAMVGVHQFCRIGSYAMVGMNSKIARDVLPYSLADGHPVQHFMLNKVGLDRRGIKGKERIILGEVFRAQRLGSSLEPFVLAAQEFKHVAHFLEFVSLPSIRGLSDFASKPSKNP
jgi:UDP-N-acetylglucosamine acyltransferase